MIRKLGEKSENSKVGKSRYSTKVAVPQRNCGITQTNDRNTRVHHNHRINQPQKKSQNKISEGKADLRTR